MVHNKFMDAALAEAVEGQRTGGLPIGCVIVRDGKIVGRGHNVLNQNTSNILHAEMAAIENVGHQSPSFFEQCTLYTTLAPCEMCSGAVMFFRIPKVIVAEEHSLRCFSRADVDCWLQARGVSVEVLHDQRCIDLMGKYIKDHPDLYPWCTLEKN